MPSKQGSSLPSISIYPSVTPNVFVSFCPDDPTEGIDKNPTSFLKISQINFVSRIQQIVDSAFAIDTPTFPPHALEVAIQESLLDRLSKSLLNCRFAAATADSSGSNRRHLLRSSLLDRRQQQQQRRRRRQENEGDDALMALQIVRIEYLGGGSPEDISECIDACVCVCVFVDEDVGSRPTRAHNHPTVPTQPPQSHTVWSTFSTFHIFFLFVPSRH